MSVCVFGSINLDHVVRVATLPLPGETILATGSERHFGGKGANQAIGAVKASVGTGAQVRMYGALGDDADGAALRDYLQGCGIDTSGIVTRTGTPSGFAIIAVAADGENHIVVAPGANGTAMAPSAANLAGCTVALAQLEVPVAQVAAFFRESRAAGALCVLNTAPALADARDLFDLTDILIFNEGELASYVGAARSADGPAAARALLTRPDQRAVVTLGAKGAVMVDRHGLLHVPAARVSRVIDTTGAGDCFCGTFAALIGHESDWEKILVQANAAAARCVQQKGAT